MHSGLLGQKISKTNLIFQFYLKFQSKLQLHTTRQMQIICNKTPLENEVAPFQPFVLNFMIPTGFITQTTLTRLQPPLLRVCVRKPTKTSAFRQPVSISLIVKLCEPSVKICVLSLTFEQSCDPNRRQNCQYPQETTKVVDCPSVETRGIQQSSAGQYIRVNC